VIGAQRLARRGWFDMVDSVTGHERSTPRRPLAAAILIGGRASRMGGIRKATLSVGGSTIIEHQLRTLRPIAEPIFVVTSATGAEEETNLDVVRDEFPDHGSLGGIYTAVNRSPHDRTLVIACDMPFLSGQFLEHMAGIDADLVIPRTSRGYEPLCAIYTKACLTSIRERLIRRELAASRLPEGIRVVEVGPEVVAAHDPDGLLFVNVNTPHDYERAKEMVEKRSKTLRDRIMDELGP
jgi:molybdopterin-guanine dinucleotide biosynthesis protein A